MRHDGSRKRLLVAALSALVLSAGAVGIADAAYAADSSCTLTYTDHLCEAGDLPANSTYHAIYFEASAYSAPSINCSVFDSANGHRVGLLRSTNRTVSTVIRGLYGTYWMMCVQGDPNNWGSGNGLMSNEDWRVS